jgi:hypothetical protein
MPGALTVEYTRALRYTFPLIRGEDVRAVQQALTALRVDPPCGGADGVYGMHSADAVKTFQQHYNVVGRISGNALPVDGQVDQATWTALFLSAQGAHAPAARIQAAAAAVRPADPTGSAAPPPLNASQVRRVRQWMSAHFGPAIEAAVANTPLDADLVYAIACQETAWVWQAWIDRFPAEQILARCVFDASGDAPNSKRDAFPANTAEFRARFGDALTQMLIDDANATRRLRGFADAQWVYKGYGIFQYDLQNISTDPAFFQNRQWGNFAACLERFMREMHAKLEAANGNVVDAVRRYNGAGSAAEIYASNVMQMRSWSAAAAATDAGVAQAQNA